MGWLLLLFLALLLKRFVGLGILHKQPVHMWVVQQQRLWTKQHINSTRICIQNIVRIVLVRSARAYIIVYTCVRKKSGTNMVAYCPCHYLSGQIVARYRFWWHFLILGTTWTKCGLWRGVRTFALLLSWSDDDERGTKWHHNGWSWLLI